MGGNPNQHSLVADLNSYIDNQAKSYDPPLSSTNPQSVTTLEISLDGNLPSRKRVCCWLQRGVDLMTLVLVWKI